MQLLDRDCKIQRVEQLTDESDKRQADGAGRQIFDAVVI
jgi:hypothetical protein